MNITPEKGWLKKQLDQAEQEIASWPKWMQTDIETQYQELLKHMEASHDLQRPNLHPLPNLPA